MPKELVLEHRLIEVVNKAFCPEYSESFQIGKLITAEKK